MNNDECLSKYVQEIQNKVYNVLLCIHLIILIQILEWC